MGKNKQKKPRKHKRKSAQMVLRACKRIKRAEYNVGKIQGYKSGVKTSQELAC